MDKVIIKGLVKQLKPFVSYNLNESFTKVRYDCPGITQEEQSRLVSLDAFPGQLELKIVVGNLLNGSFTNWEVNEWIVHQWGGIRAFDVSKHTRITEFRDHLVNGRLLSSEFQRISSLSKIASFVSSDEYFIYDSRVAFSLDGLLLKIWRDNPNMPIRFFPLPSAQGGRDVMMRRMINNLCPNASYLSIEETYTEYNNLILTLNKKKELNNDLPPCWIEMLLFALGKTDGVIERMFDFSRIKEEIKARITQQHNNNRTTSTKSGGRKEKQESKVVTLLSGTKIRGGRIVQYGYDIQYGSQRYYWFIGNKKTFRYIELLSKKGSESLDKCDIIPELERRGFDVKGKDYIYMRLDPYNETEAKALLEEIANKMRDAKEA